MIIIRKAHSRHLAETEKRCNDKSLTFEGYKTKFVYSDVQQSMEFVLIVLGLLIIAAGLFVWMLSHQRRLLHKVINQSAQEAATQEKRLRIALENQENERKKLAKDVLDGIGASLQALRNTVHPIIAHVPEPERKEIYSMFEVLTEKVRSISWELMPSTIERFGLANTIEEFAKRISAQYQQSVVFTQEGTPLSIDVNQQLLLYRIIQEAVMNSVQHAKATLITVKMHWTEGTLLLTIADDGIGFEYPSGDRFNFIPNTGLGNLKNRVSLLRATVSYQRNMPSGSILCIKLPIYAE